MNPSFAEYSLAPCSRCGDPLDPTALACPKCNTLVHEARLEELANQAKLAGRAGDRAGALGAWRAVLALLPQDSVQYRSVEKRIADLEREPEPSAQSTEPPKHGPWGKWIARLGPAGVVLWKLKTVLLIGLTKGKFLLLGFTKLPTLFSMLGTFALYWNWYGWPFAMGLVLSIYIHEMGHVAALRRYGIAASVPMFIPGFGALVMLKERPKTAEQDARVGLAGPIYGLATAIFAWLVFLVTKAPIWAAIAHVGAWINLFNLIPVWQLDGGRGFAALNRNGRLIILGIALVMWYITGTGMLFLIALGAGYRVFFAKDAQEPTDQITLLQFAGLIIFLALLCMVPAGAQRL